MINATYRSVSNKLESKMIKLIRNWILVPNAVKNPMKNVITQRNTSILPEARALSISRLEFE